VRDARPRDRAHRLELHFASIEIVEEAFAATKQKRDDVNLHLVNEAGREILLEDLGATAERHILAIGCLACLLESRLDAVGDEKECRASLHGQRLPRVMCEHENRVVEWRVIAPPSLPWVLAPRPAHRAEHVATHDRRTDVLKSLAQHIVINSRLAVYIAVQRAEGFGGKGPVVNMERPFAERILNALVRPGDVAVERYRNVESQFANLVL
jgi:hypothetical protein